MQDAVRKWYYRVFRRKASLALAGGVRKIFWAGDPRMFTRIINAGGEREQLERFLAAIRPGDVVWDVGAFIGMFAIFSAHRVGEQGQVYAFEPEAGTLSMLRRNIDLNKTAPVEVIEAALGDHDGAAIIYASKPGENAIHSLHHGERHQATGADIRLRSGDALVTAGAAKAPNVVKMDIEGAEFQALTGMRDILQSETCRYLFLELHPAELPGFGASLEAVRELLENAGFRLEHEQTRGAETHLFYRKGTAS